jgi:hypothetical protein
MEKLYNQNNRSFKTTINMEQQAVIKTVRGWWIFADCKNSASECNESSLSNCRAQPILSKSLYSFSADDISAGTG